MRSARSNTGRYSVEPLALGAEREAGRGDRRLGRAAADTRIGLAVAERSHRRGAPSTPRRASVPRPRRRRAPRRRPARSTRRPSGSRAGSWRCRRADRRTSRPRPRSPPPSSPKNAISGAASSATSRTACSLATSMALTQSPGPFARTLRGTGRTRPGRLRAPASAAASAIASSAIEVEVVAHGHASPISASNASSSSRSRHRRGDGGRPPRAITRSRPRRVLDHGAPASRQTSRPPEVVPRAVLIREAVEEPVDVARRRRRRATAPTEPSARNWRHAIRHARACPMIATTDRSSASWPTACSSRPSTHAPCPRTAV